MRTSEPDLEPSASRKLRILCLHGYHGSATTLRSQMAGLLPDLESFAELVFIDAPSLAKADFGWWHARDAHYEGWERTREAIIAAFASRGPFDGVLGFSQGAALAGLLVGLRAAPSGVTVERPLHFDFAIMISGFASRDPLLAELYAHRERYALPSLHVLGRSDSIVPNEETRNLVSEFINPTIVEHPSGHVVPTDTVTRASIRAFLEQRAHARVATATATSVTAPRSTLDLALWPAPSSPAMRVVFPTTTTSTSTSTSTSLAPALVIFRGGAYATSHGSGAGAAEWAAAHGLVGIEVAYRTRAPHDDHDSDDAKDSDTDSAGDFYPVPYADAARAVRLVRAHAAEWGIAPDRVGVLGFSAGGHLASLLSTQPTLAPTHHAAAGALVDDLAARGVRARPDFVVLAYPLISFVDGYSPGAFVGSTESFFGRRDVGELTRRRFSNELHVTADHPPTFVWTTADDALVPANHARLFAAACERADVPVTLTVFPHGAHGLGMALGDASDVGRWPSLLLQWLVARGIC